MVNYPETSIEPISPEKMGGGVFRANLPCTVAYFNAKMLEQFVKPVTLLCRSKSPPYQPFFSGDIITLFKIKSEYVTLSSEYTG